MRIEIYNDVAGLGHEALADIVEATLDEKCEFSTSRAITNINGAPIPLVVLTFKERVDDYVISIREDSTRFAMTAEVSK